MHNFFFSTVGYSVGYANTANTFSGQLAGGLWETRAQVASLYPTTQSTLHGLWESLFGYAQRSGLVYTVFPTRVWSKITPSQGKLSPQSTGPIKKTTNYIKEI